jgi:hypothetical protein
MHVDEELRSLTAITTPTTVADHAIANLSCVNSVTNADLPSNVTRYES